MSNAVITKPVRTRITFQAEREPSVARTVFCHRHGHLVPLSACASCGYAVSVPHEPAHSGATVICRAPRNGSTDHELDLAAIASRTSIDELARRCFACVQSDAGWDTLEALLLDEAGSAIPVVDGLGRPMGMISKSDMMRYARDFPVDVEAGVPERGFHVDARASVTAADIMSPLVHALPEDAPISSAIALFALEDIDQIPIVAEDRSVVGLLTMRDVVRWTAGKMGCIASPAGT